MAFGDINGTLGVGAKSITNPFIATGSVVVSLGDLIFCAYSEQGGTVTATGVTDNLGNSYTAVSAGSANLGTNLSVRAFFSVVTVSGTVTAVNLACTASGNNAAFIALVFAGTFLATASAKDANPADTNDGNGTVSINPFSFAATGTLAQASEVVVGWFGTATVLAGAATGVAPSTANTQTDGSGSDQITVVSRTVAATSSVVQQFTSTDGTSTEFVAGVASFKAAGATAGGGGWPATVVVIRQ